jgi:hypothetical protein
MPPAWCDRKYVRLRDFNSAVERLDRIQYMPAADVRSEVLGDDRYSQEQVDRSLHESPFLPPLIDINGRFCGDVTHILINASLNSRAWRPPGHCAQG